MKMSTKNIIVAVLAVALLMIVAISYFGGGDDPDREEDLEGKWYLVGRNSLDGSNVYSSTTDRSVNSIYDIEVIGFHDDGVLFNAVSQGVEFCGAQINGKVIFEYHYTGTNNDVCVTGEGYINSKGRLVTYETHYYSSNNWFVAVSIYSKSIESVSLNFGSFPSVQQCWEMDNGMFMNTNGTKNDLDGRHLIAYQRGPFLRVEMEQVIQLAGGGDPEIVTVLMNGVIVSYNGSTCLAYLVDSNGNLWSLYVTPRIAVLNAVAADDVDGSGDMVVAQREYFEGIPPALPDTPTMKNTSWVASSTDEMWGTSETDTYNEDIVIEYTEQYGFILSGTNTKEGNARGEVGYIVTDPSPSKGYVLRMGTEITDSANEDETIQEGYGFLDGDTLVVVKFKYIDGKNGAVYRVYQKQ